MVQCFTFSKKLLSLLLNHGLEVLAKHHHSREIGSIENRKKCNCPYLKNDHTLWIPKQIYWKTIQTLSIGVQNLKKSLIFMYINNKPSEKTKGGPTLPFTRATRKRKPNKLSVVQLCKKQLKQWRILKWITSTIIHHYLG